MNAAELARSLPAQLRLALAPMPARGVNPAVGAAAARVTVRKLIKQQSSGTLGGLSTALANANSAGGTTAIATSAAQGWAGSAPSAIIRPKVYSDQGTIAASRQRNQVGSDMSAAMQGSTGSGVVGVVSASLAAAAAAVTGAGSSGVRSQGGDRQPLLSGNDRSAPSS